MKRYDVLGTRVSETNLIDSVSYFNDNFDLARNNYICCANAHTVVYAYENHHYKEILNNSFLTIPDGGPIAKIGEKQDKNVEKISGVDFMEYILKTDNMYRHFFYGETEDNLIAFIEFLRNEYPNIKVSGYKFSKFRELNRNEEKELIDRIEQTNTDVVWVALGAPKQEEFCSRMCKQSNACFVAVGGAFKVISGIIPRAPLWMQKHSLEWLYRLAKEPKRLFKRYFIGNIKFLLYKYRYYYGK